MGDRLDHDVEAGPGVDAGLQCAVRRRTVEEVSLVDEGLRSARALCAQPDTRLVIIPREKLMLLCDTYPQLGYRLMRNLAADLAMKIRNTDLQVSEYLTWMRRS